MISHRGFECSKSRIILEDKVTVLIPNLFKLFPMILVGELLVKLMCVWGRLNLSECVLALVQGQFLLVQGHLKASNYRSFS